jgi:hypothetical protein
MPQPAKVIRMFEKPNSDNATCDAATCTILEHVARIDLTCRAIYDPITQAPKRPAHIISACDALALLSFNMRQVNAYLLHNPYRPLVDEGIQKLAAKTMQVLAVTDWWGVPTEYVDLMKHSARKIMEAAGNRLEWHRIEAIREAKRKEGGQ